MKVAYGLVAWFLAAFLSAQGVTPEEWGLREYRLEDDELGEVLYYVTTEGLDREKPLLFLAQGSGGIPIMIQVHCGEKSVQLGTIPPDMLRYFAKDHHVALIGKPGTPFTSSVTVDEIDPLDILENWQPTAEYVAKCGMEWQVAASAKVIDHLCETLPIAEQRVIALGMSAGGRIVTRLAAENHRVTHLVSLVSGGLNQFYSSIINLRLDAAAGKITHEEAQRQIDELFETYAKIYADPTSTKEWYYGHPYRRWGSFCTDIPLDHLVGLDIPILYLGGTADRNSPILALDYVRLEFLRRGKTNLTYIALPNVDHSLYETVVENGEEKGVSHRQEIFETVTDWLSFH